MATVASSLSAEEFWMLPDDGLRCELVRGRIVTMNMPGFRHGEICVNVTVILSAHIKSCKCGRLVSNDTGVQTERDPDTVRGADLAYYSYGRLPQGTSPDRYPSVAPEIVFEVRSPWDRWSEIQIKVGEYLNADVLAVCVLDPETDTVTVYRANEPPRVLRGDDELLFPGILDDFRMPVLRFFE